MRLLTDPFAPSTDGVIEEERSIEENDGVPAGARQRGEQVERLLVRQLSIEVGPYQGGR